MAENANRADEKRQSQEMVSEACLFLNDLAQKTKDVSIRASLKEYKKVINGFHQRACLSPNNPLYLGDGFGESRSRCAIITKGDWRGLILRPSL